MDANTKIGILDRSAAKLNEIAAKKAEGASNDELLRELQNLRQDLLKFAQPSQQQQLPAQAQDQARPQSQAQPQAQAPEIVLEKAYLDFVLKNKPGMLLLQNTIGAGKYRLVADDSSTAITCTLGDSSYLFVGTDFINQFNNHGISDNVRKSLFPKKRKLYTAPISYIETVETPPATAIATAIATATATAKDESISKEVASESLDAKTMEGAKKAYACASVLGHKLPTVASQMEKLLPLTDADKDILAAVQTAVKKIITGLAKLLGDTKDAPTSDYADLGVFDLTDKLLQLVEKYKLQEDPEILSQLSDFLKLQSEDEDIEHSETTDTLAKSIKFCGECGYTDPALDVSNLCPKCSHAMDEVIQKAGPTDAYAPVRSASDQSQEEIETQDVLDHIHEQFVLRSPFVYLVGSIANNGKTSNDVDILIKGPLDDETRRIVEHRIDRMLPEEIAKRVQYLGDGESAGPFAAHCGLYDLVVQRRDDYATVVEMAVAKSKSAVVKQSQFLEDPESGDVAYPAVFQLHFRGKSVHGDLRIKTADTHLIGYTFMLQKSSKVPDVATLDKAKSIAADFSPGGSWWNKDIQGPSSVQVVLKPKHPVGWLDLNSEHFEPGSVGATKFKPGFMVSVARPKVYYGARTKLFHEWFAEGDDNFSGRLVFRLVGSGDKPFWKATLAKTLLPYVLRRRAIQEDRVPPKGYSWLPPKLKAVVPKQFRYWLIDKRSQRKEVLAALINEKFFTEENVKLIDNKIQRVVAKYEAYAPPEEEEKSAYPSGSTEQLFPSDYVRQILAKSVASLFPAATSDAKPFTYCEPYYDSGLFLGLWNATVKAESRAVLNVYSQDSANLYSELVAKSTAREELKAMSWFGSRSNFDAAITGSNPHYTFLYKKYFQDDDGEFDASKTGAYAALPERLAKLQLQAAANDFYGGMDPLEFLDTICAASDDPFILIDPPETTPIDAIKSLVDAARAQRMLYLVLTAEPIPGISTHKIEKSGHTLYAGINYRVAPQSIDTQDLPFFYDLPEAIEKSAKVPFALVKSAEPSGVCNLLIEATPGTLSHYSFATDPFSQAQPSMLTTMQHQIDGALALDTLDDLEDAEIIHQGLLQVDPTTAIKKYRSETLPAFCLIQASGSTYAFDILDYTLIATQPAFHSSSNEQETQISAEEKIEKQEKYKDLKLSDGSMVKNIQIWDPKDMSADDNKSEDRLKLRPPALFRPMKVASGDKNTFTSKELSRIYSDFATKKMLEVGIAVEPKYNGWRTILQKTSDGAVFIFSEEAVGSKTAPTNYASLWPEVKDLLASVPGPYIIDAEFTAVDEHGGPIPRRELAAYRTATKPENTDLIRLKVFDAFVVPEAGNIMDKTYMDRRKALGSLLKSVKSKMLEIVPMMIVNGKKDLVAAMKWARRVVNSEGSMLKSVEHTATLNENDLLAKVKSTRELKGIVYGKHEVKGSPGTYNFNYAIGPVTQDGQGEADADRWADTIEINGKLYVPVGKTFNTKVKADIGDVILIEVSEILYYKAEIGEYKIRGFAPIVVEKIKGRATTIKEVLEMLELGETKKLASAAQAALGRAVALDDLPLTLLKKSKEERFIKGVVLVPGVPDAHGDIYDEETVRQAAHHFMANSEALGKQHTMGLSRNKLVILECYLLDTTCEIGGQEVKEGTWILAARVRDDELWEEIKQGKLTGWSIEGSALAEPLI